MTAGLNRNIVVLLKVNASVLLRRVVGSSKELAFDTGVGRARNVLSVNPLAVARASSSVSCVATAAAASRVAVGVETATLTASEAAAATAAAAAAYLTRWTFPVAAGVEVCVAVGESVSMKIDQVVNVYKG